MNQTVIFVEDDEHLRHATTQALELAGISVRPFGGAEAALAALVAEFDGVVVSDIRMPRLDGLQLLAAVQAFDSDLPVVLVTGHGDVPMAVAALKNGAYDFLTKPFAVDHLVATVSRALERRSLIVENRRLRAAAEASEAESPLIGNSPAIVRLRRAIRQLAMADIDVLIDGETGTGKELVAMMLHRQGPRAAKPFVAVDCATLDPDGLRIELFGHAADSVAHTRFARDGLIKVSSGGTLLLDEIERLPATLQTRLLRVIEEREVHPIGALRADAVNLHVIATSKSDLAAEVATGRLQPDLYHRLASARLSLAPLRERHDDRLLLYTAFVNEATHQLGGRGYITSDDERRYVMAHSWPGNVRELRNYAFERVLARTAGSVPANAGQQDLRDQVAAFEAMIIINALEATQGSVVGALKRLKLPRKTLYDKLKRYGIYPDEFRSGKRE